LVFSSTLFVFLFLPLALAGHVVAPRLLRNAWLLLVSLLFYAWGEPWFVLVMLLSIAGNWALGLWLDRARGDAMGTRLALATTVAVNVGLLGFCKYSGFAVENLNALRAALGSAPVSWTPIVLPIGISFFTFQAMSYVIDVHRREAPAARNPLDVALYVSLFPQLIAGPIVRYRDVAGEIGWRSTRLSDFASGARRFVIGLSKKVLVANVVSVPADRMFGLPPHELTTPVAWMGTVCYTLQIYFDFSGYSDMAIGMGRMLGFHFLENFDYPYVAASVREFWRRWHVSLSTWFRDYLYIPLGGNRGSAGRTHVNLVIVFLLCGLWHGASWVFVVWGLYHGLFLVLERTPLERARLHLPRPLRHAYALLVVVVGWVLFRSDSLGQAGAVLAAMAGSAAGDPRVQPVPSYLTTDVALAMVAGFFGSAPVLPTLGRAVERALGARSGSLLRGGYEAACLAGISLLFAASALVLSGQTHDPFIYFRF
jgi:alginate O-acetyltransferase complex protein AlgI